MTTTAKPDLRTEMPNITDFIDRMRAAFGKDAIDNAIRSGIKGQPTFFASENGHEIGTRNTARRSVIGWDRRGRSYAYELPAGATVEQIRIIERNARNEANSRANSRRGVGPTTYLTNINKSHREGDK